MFSMYRLLEMSKRRTDIPTTKKAAKAYIKAVENNPWVDSVWVKGSRSPLTEKAPHRNSDWDLEIVVNNKDFTLVSPRLLGILHADIYFVEKPSEVSVPWRKVIK